MCKKICQKFCLQNIRNFPHGELDLLKGSSPQDFYGSGKSLLRNFPFQKRKSLVGIFNQNKSITEQFYKVVVFHFSFGLGGCEFAMVVL